MEPSQPANQKVTATSSFPEVAEDCWNKIGVMGDRTCSELERVIHCRNCSVYSTAGQQLLDRDLPADYRRDWSELLSREKESRSQNKTSVIIFRIGEEWLALPTRVFQEVTQGRPIHSLPHRQHEVVLGVINVRGELLVCVCLGRLLGIKRDDDLPPNRLVVAEWQGSILTFPVDEIHGVHRYSREELKEAPATLARANASFTLGMLAWQDKMAGCLDENLVFSMLNRSLT
jgi:chemotaxis-related protein WspD